jgi:hypothetical protein
MATTATNPQPRWPPRSSPRCLRVLSSHHLPPTLRLPGSRPLHQSRPVSISLPTLSTTPISHRRTHPASCIALAALFLLHRLNHFPAARGSSSHSLFISAFMITSKVVCDEHVFFLMPHVPLREATVVRVQQTYCRYNMNNLSDACLGYVGCGGSATYKN